MGIVPWEQSFEFCLMYMMGLIIQMITNQLFTNCLHPRNRWLPLQSQTRSREVWRSYCREFWEDEYRVLPG